MRFDKKKWISFLDRYGLRGDTNGKGAVQSWLMAKIYHRAIFDDTHQDQDDMGTYTARMPLFRMGKFCLGKCPPLNTAINSSNESPQITHAMQKVKINLIKATMRLLVVNKTKQEDVLAVEQWIIMTKKQWTQA